MRANLTTEAQSSLQGSLQEEPPARNVNAGDDRPERRRKYYIATNKRRQFGGDDNRPAPCLNGRREHESCVGKYLLRRGRQAA